MKSLTTPHPASVTRMALPAFALLAALATPTPASAHDYYYWCAHPQEKVYQTSGVPSRRGTSGNPSVTMALAAARAEFEGRQLVLRPTAGLRDVWIEPSDLACRDASGSVVGTIDASEVSVAKVGYVYVSKPSTGYSRKGWEPDPLLPMTLANGEPIGWRAGAAADPKPRSLAAGENQPFYVLFHVPADAVPGTYTGTLSVTCEGDDGSSLPELRVPVRLTVYGFSVARKSLKTSFWLQLKWASKANSNGKGWLDYDVDVDGEDRVPESTTFHGDQYLGWFKLMNDHRISPDTLITAWQTGSDWAPPDDAGKMVARQDYLADYLGTGQATTFDGERLNFNHVMMPETGTPSYVKDPFSSSSATNKAIAYYKTMREQLGKFASKAQVFVIDEPGKGDRARVERYGAFVDKYVPGVKFMLTTSPTTWDWKPLKNVDTYVERLHFFYRDYSRWVKPLRKSGKRVWIYQHATPWQRETPLYLIDKPLAESRVPGWFAYDTNADGLLYYCIDRWKYENSTYRDPYKYPLSFSSASVRSNGDGSLIYPGYYPALGLNIQGAPPAGSLRFEALRDGLEDEETLEVLEDRAGPAVCDYYVSRILGGPKHVTSGGKPTFPSYSKRASTYESAKTAIGHRLSASTAYESVAGANRYATALQASRKGFDRADCVVISTGTNWPDALGGAALAAAEDGPILLTDPNSLSGGVIGEIRRLGARRAIILGSGRAVSARVQSALARELGAANVTRIGGRDRYETAERIARAVAARLGDAYDGTAFVATGGGFPDALAASPLAAAKGWPILLAPPRAPLRSSTAGAMRAIGVDRAIVLGGGSVVSAGVENALVRAYGRGDVTRLAGRDRYATAVAVARFGVANAGLTYDGCALATGIAFPDALAGGVLQGESGSVLLLTQPDTLSGAVKSLLSANRGAIARLRFLGSTGALRVAPREQVRAVLN